LCITERGYGMGFNFTCFKCNGAMNGYARYFDKDRCYRCEGRPSSLAYDLEVNLVIEDIKYDLEARGYSPQLISFITDIIGEKL